METEHSKQCKNGARALLPHTVPKHPLQAHIPGPVRKVREQHILGYNKKMFEIQKTVSNW